MDGQRKFLRDVAHGLIRDGQGWAIVAAGSPKVLLRKLAGEWRGESAERNDSVRVLETLDGRRMLTGIHASLIFADLVSLEV